MQKRPLSLYLCALLFLYFPLELFFRWERGLVVLPLDIVFSVIFPALLLVGLIRVVKFGWYTLVAVVALWGVRDLYEHYASRTTDLSPLFAHIFIYIVSLSYFINPRIRTLYFDPRRRWWKTKPRYETHLPSIVRFRNEWHYPIMRNISEGGCFLELAHPAEMGENVHLTIPLPVPLNLSAIKVEGIVRWVTNNATFKGMGLEFQTPSPEQGSAIKEFVRKQL